MTKEKIVGWQYSFSTFLPGYNSP